MTHKTAILTSKRSPQSTSSVISEKSLKKRLRSQSPEEQNLSSTDREVLINDLVAQLRTQQQYADKVVSNFQFFL